MITIRQYAKSKKTNLSRFAKFTDISQAYLYEVADNNDANFTANFMRKIYEVTKEKYGEGLKPSEYSNIMNKII